MDWKPRHTLSKARGAVLGGGIGGAAATIAVWIIEATFSVDVPDKVEAAIAVVAASLIALVGAYFAPENEPAPRRNFGS